MVECFLSTSEVLGLCLVLQKDRQRDEGRKEGKADYCKLQITKGLYHPSFNFAFKITRKGLWMQLNGRVPTLHVQGSGFHPQSCPLPSHHQEAFFKMYIRKAIFFFFFAKDSGTGL